MSTSEFPDRLSAVLNDPEHAIDRDSALHHVIDDHVDDCVCEDLLEDEDRAGLTAERYLDPLDRVEAVAAAVHRRLEEDRRAVAGAELLADAMRITGAKTFGDLMDAARTSGAHTLAEYVDSVLMDEGGARS